MTLDYQLEPSDLVAFSEEYRRFIPDFPSRLYYYGVLPALFVALALVTQSLAVAAVFALLYLSSGWLIRHWVQQRYRRAAYSDDNISIQTLPRRVALSDDGVTFTTDVGVLLYRWPFIRQVFCGSRYVIFELTPTERMHIPIRAFRDKDHVQQFISAAISHVTTRTA